MINYFNAHTIDCVCHTIRSMFRVLGIYNFGFALYYTYYSIHKQTLEKSKKQQLKLTKLPKRKCQSNNECTNVFLVYVHLRADS